MRWVWFDEVSSLPDGWWDKVEAVLKLKYQSYFLGRAIGYCDLDRFARQGFLNPDDVRRAFELSLGICQEKGNDMSDKVVIEGKLCSWQISGLHVGISIDAPMVEGDFAALSGRRVRVTVEVVEPDPEPRCPFCGGRIKIEDESEIGIDYKITGFSAVCQECPALGCGPTRQAALDALKAWKPPEPKCPFCGFVVRVDNLYGQLNEGAHRVFCKNVAECGADGVGPTRQAALDALAEWLKPCPRCGGKAEYRAQCNEEGTPNGWWRVRCMTDECKIVSPVFLVKAFAGRWWNKREGRHG